MAELIDTLFLDSIAALPRHAEVESRKHGDPIRDGSSLTVSRCAELFDAQLGSRHLDLAARSLRAEGAGFYTIGSSGHEGNAAVAGALRLTDPALLHYRSGAFFLERARQGSVVGPLDNPLRDILLGIVAARDEPIAGGRHKVFGRHDLNVIPQTSTIASHLPRAVGVAFATCRAPKLGVDAAWPQDSVTVCSFGDASANHSTAVGAINAALYTAYSGVPLPLLLVCEDNGIGISVKTPSGWIERTYGNRDGLAYFGADGCDIASAYDAATAAAAFVRSERRPAFLHLRTVRLMGHAGSDLEAAYRVPGEIAADQRRDPLLATARLLVTAGLYTSQDVVDRYEAKRDDVAKLAREATGRPRLESAADIMMPLQLPDPNKVAAAVLPRGVGRPAPEEDRLTLAQSINRALLDILGQHPNSLVFGEDVARKGGVYGVTRGLLKKVGPARVFDTLLDEQSILGVALGAGVSGLLPIPEIQYLAYLHNAADQIRGEAATLKFFSGGLYRNPMVVRVAGYGYQKGFGGHFHNDNAVAALRDIPGIVVASPARPDDAAAMLRTCAAAAQVDGTTCVYLEPIALYHVRDLHTEGDAMWSAPYASVEEWGATHVPIGSARVYGSGKDLTIATFGNGVYMSLRVAQRLAHVGIEVRVVDLRWLVPLPTADLLREANATGRVLIVDETRRSGGVGEGLVTDLVAGGFDGDIVRVASEDSFIPLGDAALRVLLSEETIEAAALALCGSGDGAV
ncbi:MFS transporter [Antrihabitans sp. YC3-6]|uniref:MFS transporter n=1 Tax=Antrihabitans stalagmiti TaxID=2799499 RepID=A0A934U0X5_9NOCA|nr:thiamine pyrophosphate-dependent enzyme [Antrihabitans stalagmiti]MBJ8337727.1 MFS transporter [Antrihabitans stalagmiti]